MGWKTSTIFANSEADLEVEIFFESLGIYELQNVDEKSFDSIRNPDDDRIISPGIKQAKTLNIRASRLSD